MADPFIGEICMLPYSYVPRFWARCDGQRIPIDQNPALYAVIGSVYGTPSSTLLTLPNLQGRSPLHSGQGPGLQIQYYLGESSGIPSVILDDYNIPTHNHTARAINQIGNQPEATNHLIANASGVKEYKESPDATTLKPMHPDAVADTGNDVAHENRQPYLAVPFCIALEGYFPPRP